MSFSAITLFSVSTCKRIPFKESPKKVEYCKNRLRPVISVIYSSNLKLSIQVNCAIKSAVNSPNCSSVYRPKYAVLVRA